MVSATLMTAVKKLLKTNIIPPRITGPEPLVKTHHKILKLMYQFSPFKESRGQSGTHLS